MSDEHRRALAERDKDSQAAAAWILGGCGVVALVVLIATTIAAYKVMTH